jgi:hypothetical protein
MTEKEIVQALRCTSTPGDHTSNCEQCPYWKKEQLNGRLKEKLGTDTWTSCDIDKVGLDAADLIERLTAENADLRKELEWKGMVIALAQRKQAEAEAERDAAIVDLKIFAGCSACRHCCNHRRDHQESLLLTCCDCTKKKNCKCGSCSLGRSNWEWRGLPEEPEEGEKA